MNIVTPRIAFIDDSAKSGSNQSQHPSGSGTSRSPSTTNPFVASFGEPRSSVAGGSQGTSAATHSSASLGTLGGDASSVGGGMGTANTVDVNAHTPTNPPAPVLDKLGRAWGTGRRKSSVARVILKPGTGNIVVNKKSLDEYLSRDVNRILVRHVLKHVGSEGSFDVVCRVHGGGTSGQAGAICHGIARALLNFDPTLRGVLREGGFLTRDAREVERKKYGRRKARRSFQFSKR